MRINLQQEYMDACDQVHRLAQTIKERDAEIAAMAMLLSRAADALEKYTTYPIGMVMSVTLRESGKSVLAELRKAAE